MEEEEDGKAEAPWEKVSVYMWDVNGLMNSKARICVENEEQQLKEYS